MLQQLHRRRLVISLFLLTVLEPQICSDMVRDKDSSLPSSWRRVVSPSNAVGRHSVIRHYRLMNRCSSKHVRITSSHVDAQGDFSDIYAELRVVSESFRSHLRLQSARSRTYLCFNRRGRLTVKLSGADARCLFQELQTTDHYTEFRSVAERRWYVGFSRRGRRLRADSWDHVDEHNVDEHRLRHGRRRRRRRRSVHRCRQFVKTQVTLINDDDHEAAFNHQPVDFQRIYFRLRAPDAAVQRDSEAPRT